MTQRCLENKCLIILKYQQIFDEKQVRDKDLRFKAKMLQTVRRY